MKTLDQWHAWGPELDRIYQEELGRSVYADPIGFTDWTYHWREEGWDGERVRQEIRTKDEWIQLHQHDTHAPVPTPPSPMPPALAGRLIAVADGPFVPRFYSYWSNAWIDGNAAYLFAGHVDGNPRFYRVNLITTRVEEVPTLLGHRGTTEGWSWDSRGWIYLCDGPQLLRVSPFSNQYEVVLDISADWPGCVLWQSHSSDDGRTHCATIARVTDAGPYERLGTIAQRDGRISYWPATGELDESQVTDAWLIIKETRERNGPKLDNRVINLDTGTDYWLLDEAGAVGHSDCDAGLLVGEDNYAGACTALDFMAVQTRRLFDTWNMGHVSLRRGVCLRSNHEAGALELVALDGSGLTEVYRHGVITNDYDRQVRANLDPTGRIACFLQEGRLCLLVL